MKDVREACINVVGDWQMPVLGELNETACSIDEKLNGAVNEMRSG